MKMNSSNESASTELSHSIVCFSAFFRNFNFGHKIGLFLKTIAENITFKS